MRWGFLDPDVTTIPALVIFHLLAAYAMLYTNPDIGLIVATILLSIFTGFGITVGYHRYFAHHGFKAPKAVAYILAILGSIALQGPLRWWVGHHRAHHRAPDTDDDPYNARKGFWYSHVLWLKRQNWGVDESEDHPYFKMTRDIGADKFLALISNQWVYLAVFLFILSFLVIVAFGFTAFLWLVAVRLVIVWNVTFAVNSVTHRWGYRNYETNDLSTNHPVVGVLALGEGWHNNHHAYPRLAQHGHKWWELDLSWKLIQLLEAVGLARDVKRLDDRVTSGER
jgi:stearoyl-CoA desaturase (delta-9 desaturase)